MTSSSNTLKVLKKKDDSFKFMILTYSSFSHFFIYQVMHIWSKFILQSSLRVFIAKVFFHFLQNRHFSSFDVVIQKEETIQFIYCWSNEKFKSSMISLVFEGIEFRDSFLSEFTLYLKLSLFFHDCLWMIEFLKNSFRKFIKVFWFQIKIVF